MRIIAGSAKGAKLNAPAGLTTRPTSDRVRESLFNIISHDLWGAHFLDLFAGSGAVGLEAISRGAALAVFADSRAECICIINKNAEKTRLRDRARILPMEASKAIRILSREGQVFDLVYLDPPYHNKKGKNMVFWALEEIEAHSLIEAESLIIAERDGTKEHNSINGIPPYFELVREERYGNTVLEFIRKRS